MTSFCAICVSDLPPGHLRLAPLGRDGARVNVCDACFDEKPIAKADDRSAYTAPDESVGASGSILALFTLGAERVIPNYRAKARVALLVSMLPMHDGIEDGHVLVRISRCDERGRRRDHQAAYEAACRLFPKQPLEAIGQTSRFFLFQRPDPAALAKAKAQRDDHRDPLASLNAMQRHGARR